MIRLLFILAILLTGVLSAGPPCPVGWSQQGIYCYWFSKDTVRSWNDAQKFCESMGGNLAGTYNDTFVTFVEQLAGNSNYAAWSGLYKDGSSWKFIDKTATFWFKGWMPGEPQANAGNCAAIRTTTNGGYFALTCSHIQPFFCSQKVSTCETKYFTYTKGSLNSPNYPANYANNENCVQYIIGKENTFVSLSFDVWIVEEKYDVVYLYDGYYPDSSARLIANITSDPTAANSPYKNAFRTTSNTMTVRFITDSSMNKKGWHANYNIMVDSSPIYQSGSSGTLLSPNYPSDYPNNIEQYYYVNTADGTQIQLTFDYFDTETTYYATIPHDYLEIYDGPNITSTMLGSFNGHIPSTLPALPGPFTTTGNSLTMRFITDYSLTYKGFNATWIIV